MTQEHKDKISKARKEYWNTLTTEERKEKVGSQGENNAMYGKTGKDSPQYGLKRTDKTKKKMSEAKKGKTAEEIWGKEVADKNKERAKKLGESWKGIPKSKEQTYNSIKTLKKFREDYRQVNYYNVTTFSEFVEILTMVDIIEMTGKSDQSIYLYMRKFKNREEVKALSKFNITNIEKSHREYIKKPTKQ